jgi:hypothetical protein
MAAGSNAHISLNSLLGRPAQSSRISRDLPDLEEPIFASKSCQIWFHNNSSNVLKYQIYNNINKLQNKSEKPFYSG